MSYADVAKVNAPPPTAADPRFLEGSYNQPPTDGHGASDVPSQALPDVNSRKVNVVPANTDLHHLHTQTEQDGAEVEAHAEEQARAAKQQAEQAAKSAEQTAHKAKDRAQEEADKLAKRAEGVKEDAKEGLKKAEKKISQAAKDTSRQAERSWAEFSSDPKKWASTLGAFNIVILGGLGVAAYTQRETIKTWDRRFIATVVGGVAAVVGLQSWFAADKAAEQSGKK
ncbi:hypothetical protein V8E36_006241 [Tilletia maclaganii]